MIYFVKLGWETRRYSIEACMVYTAKEQDKSYILLKNDLQDGERIRKIKSALFSSTIPLSVVKCSTGFQSLLLVKVGPIRRNGAVANNFALRPREGNQKRGVE